MTSTIRLLTLCALLMVATISVDLCDGQTFQYSRGWINGKRSSDAATASLVADDGVLPAQLLANGRQAAAAVEASDASPVESPCNMDQREVIVLTREHMMQLLTHAMHSMRSVRVLICMNPDTKSTHLQAMF